MSEVEGEPPAPDAAGQDDERPFPVVAVGASAGGLDAFSALLDALPQEPGVAFLFAAHLPSTSPTMLPEILSRKGRFPVAEATEGARIEVNHGYVIPPGQYLEIVDGSVHLEPLEPGHPKLTIDRLFRSFAEVLGERAIGVILSGTGSDGTLGLEAIKAAGGVTFASDESSAKYPGMPRSAVASGAVDHILPVEEIAEKLAKIARIGDGREPAPKVDGDAMQQILSVLRDATGHDFSEYKKGTLQRRIERRQRALGLPETEAYAQRLAEDEQEPLRLFRDLLVGVTSFFRDADVFEALEKRLLPELLAARRRTDGPLRAWVPACSTGEEAYSIAMTLLDALGGQRRGEPAVQVFATDIDAAALDVARRGLYPASIAADVPQDKLRRYFVREGDTYQVSEYLRDKLIFSVHSLIRDPPFSRLDLLSCRNFLIYLEPNLQRRVFPIFHYALREDGLLVLGGSESTGDFTDLFEAVDKQRKIFRRRAGHTQPLELASRGSAGPRHVVAERDDAPEARPRDVAAKVERALRERHTPPLLVVREDGEIVRVQGRTAGILELPQGAPSTNVLKMSTPGGRAELRAALLQAHRARETVVLGSLESPTLPPDRRLHVTVEPLDPKEEDGLLLVLFDVREVEPARSEEVGEQSSRQLRELEDEVRTLRDALQTTVEDLESTNEELTSSNEELLSMNEELQSANEELETSKEEVQSVNEELSSVNSELTEKVQELTRINNDITNLLASTQVATVFLDHELRVSRFTPAVTELYKLQPTDIGRPIADLRSAVEYAELAEDAEHVLRDLRTVERKVQGVDGEFYLARMMPYRTLDQRIEGVVVTFVDVTSLEKARQELTAALAAARHYKEALDASTQVALLDADGRAVEVNARLAELYGDEPAALEGGLRILDPDAIDAETLGEAWAALKQGRVWRGVLPFTTRTEDARIVEATIVPLLAIEDQAQLHLALIHDITDRVRAAEAVRESETRFRALFERGPIGIALLESGDQIVQANPALCQILERAADALEGTRLSQYAVGEDQRLDEELVEEILDGKRKRFEVEKRFKTGDERTIVVSEAVSSIPAGDGAPRRLIATLQDVTEARRTAEALRTQSALAQLGEMAAVMAHEVRNALAGIRGAVDVIGGRLPEGSEERDAVSEVRERIGGLESTVQDLMRFSRPRAPRFERVRLRSLLQEVADSVRAATPNVRLHIVGDEVTVKGDPQLLLASFLNLGLNAAQAVGDDGSVEMRIEPDADGVRVIVKDDGCGIPDELRERVFEPFFTTRSRGTGLGMPIAKRIFEAHGGNISLESVEGDGTAVTVRLRRDGDG